MPAVCVVGEEEEKLVGQHQKEAGCKMEEKLNVLVGLQTAVRRKMARVKEAIAQHAGVPNLNLKRVNFLKVHLETVNKCYGEYNGFQNDIYALALQEDQHKQQDANYVEFEMLHNELVIELNDLLDAVVNPNSNTAVVPAAGIVVQQYLPPLNVPLPTFDGTYESWFSFKCMFQNVMARYTAESPAIKLYHLRNSLVGKAAGVIDQDIVNNNDYDAAWDFLQEMYEDKRMIIDRHIAAFRSLPKLTPDNVLELRELIDKCVKGVEALKTFELPVNGLGEQMLLNQLATKMDRDTRKAWEAEQKAKELPTYVETIEFLKKRCRILERLEQSSATEPGEEPTRRTVAMVIANEACCTFCSQLHNLDECEQFEAKGVNERFSHFRKSVLCFNCSQRGHRASECTSTNCCRKCSKRHHTLLHTEKFRKKDSQRPTNGSGTTEVPQTAARCPAGDVPEGQILLPTVSVKVYGRSGAPHLCRALIDSCSEKNFVTERFAKTLAIKEERVNYQVSGLNGSTTKLNRKVRTKISSRTSNFETEVELLITPKITGDQPVKSLDVSRWNVPPDVDLADPDFNIKGPVDMLLGAAIFWDLMKAGRLDLAANHPSLTKTEFGWVVGGVH